MTFLNVINIILMLESRVSRDRDSYQCEGVPGLYPCGEGAGYAGGIVSAAVDGLNVAQSVISQLVE